MIRKAWGAFLINPFEISVALLNILVGVAFGLSGLHLEPASAINVLPDWLLLCWSAMHLVAGIGMVVGVMSTGHLARAGERAALYLSISAWSTYAITVAYLSHQAHVNGYLGVMFGLAMTLGCVGRAFALKRVDRAMSHVLAIRESEVDE